MILLALLIGAILIVAAVRNSQGSLFSALIADVPAFVIWAAALIAVGAIGFVPGLKPISRGLLALVLTVIILNNWTQIQAGFTAAAADTSTAATDKAAGIKAGATAGNAFGGAAGSMFDPGGLFGHDVGQLFGSGASDAASTANAVQSIAAMAGES